MNEFVPVTKTFKKHRKKGLHNGLKLREVFELELEIYHRLNGYKNFPRLISFDKNNFTITIENCGLSLHKIRQVTNPQFSIINLDEQINNICYGLKKNNITYLDLDPQNICFKNNSIFLIDFDKTVIDGNPKSRFLNEMYINFLVNVTEESFKKTLKEFIINPKWPRYQYVS